MKWILPLLSALLLSLSFEEPFLWWIALTALVPFLTFLQILKNEHANAYRNAFFGGWIFGFVFFSFIFRFVLYSFPGGWAGVANTFSAGFLFAIAWLGLSLFVSLSFALFGVLSLKFFRILPLAILPSLWILAEYLRSVLFGIFTWGPGATLGDYWTFGSLGYVFIDTPIVFWSRLVGLYGLSFLVVLVNILFLRILKKEFYLIFPLAISTFFLLFAPGLLFLKEPETKTIRIALVHTNILLGSLNGEGFNLLWEKAVAKENKFEQPDIVIFPEGGNLFSSDSEQTLLKNIFSEKGKDGLVITSASVADTQGVREQMIFRNQNNEILSVQDKTFLIPGGEYFPVVLKIFLYLQDKTLFERFVSSRARIPGDISEKPISFGETKIGALMCSSIVSPAPYRSLTNEGAEILVNSASQIVFRNQPFFLRYMKTMARFHAISNGRPFLQASNGGQSFLIDSKGGVVEETSSFGNQILFVKAFPSRVKNMYVRLGDWPLIAALVLVICSIFRSRRFRLQDPI